MDKKEKDKDFSKFFHSVVDSEIWANWSFKAKAVYVVINRYANYNSRKALPTVETIAKLAGVSEDSVNEGIKEIICSGYMSKKRGNVRIGFRNIYTLYKQPDLTPDKLIGDILRKKSVKCKPKKDPITGKFVPSREIHGDYSREKAVNSTSRENHHKKESLEILNRDTSAGSASACSKSQASPAPIKGQKSLKGISNKTLSGLKESLGGVEALRQYLKSQGYPPEEIEGVI